MTTNDAPPSRCPMCGFPMEPEDAHGPYDLVYPWACGRCWSTKGMYFPDKLRWDSEGRAREIEEYGIYEDG